MSSIFNGVFSREELAKLDFKRVMFILASKLAEDNDTDIYKAFRFIKFKPAVSNLYPISDIESIEYSKKNSTVYATVYLNTLNLLGSGTPLPGYFVEYIKKDIKGSESLQGIITAINSAILKYFAKLTNEFSYTDIYRKNATDDYSKLIRSFVGININSDRLDYVRLMPIVGLLAQRSKSKSTVESILRHYFNNRSIYIKEFVKRQVRLSKDNRNNLSRQNCNLSVNLMLGEIITDYTTKFVVEIRDLNLNKLQSFSKLQKCYLDLYEILRFCLDRPLVYDLHLYLTKENIQPLTIADNNFSKIGSLSWIGIADGKSPVVIKGEKC